MRVSARRGASAFFNGLIVTAFLYLLINPEIASASVTEGIYFCVKIIVPSLYIYMILARMIISMPFSELLFSRLGRYGTEVGVFTLGMLCGFPIGAKSAVFLYENGRISKKRAEFICAFTNNASVSFLLSYMGAILFSDIRVGIRLVVFQLISSLSTAIIIRFVCMKKEDFKATQFLSGKRENLGEAVIDSTYTMLSVCALIITFFVLGEIALNIVPAAGIWLVLLRGLFEFSSGCASAVSLEPDMAFLASGLLIGFSGLCVIMQVLSVIRGILSPRLYLAGRLISTAIFGILLIVFGIA